MLEESQAKEAEATARIQLVEVQSSQEIALAKKEVHEDTFPVFAQAAWSTPLPPPPLFTSFNFIVSVKRVASTPPENGNTIIKSFATALNLIKLPEKSGPACEGRAGSSL